MQLLLALPYCVYQASAFKIKSLSHADLSVDIKSSFIIFLLQERMFLLIFQVGSHSFQCLI